MTRNKLVIALAVSLLLSRAGVAQESFYRVYQFETPLKGHLELTQWSTAIAKSDLSYDHFGKDLSRQGLWAHSLEAEYGVGDHFVLAGYADFEDPAGHPFTFTRSRVEARYRFGERYEHFINTAIYAEYYMPNQAYSGSHELETRLIMDKDVEDFRLVLNPVLSRYFGGEEDQSWQFALSGGVYYRRGKRVQPGIEYYENFGEKTAEIFPGVDINLSGTLVWNLGAGFGLTGGSDKLVFKSILQLDLMALRPSRFMRHPYTMHSL